VKHLILIFLISIIACDEKEKEVIGNQAEISNSKFQLSDSTYVILEFNNDWDWIFKNVKPTRISQIELNEIEEILKVAIIENNVSQKIELEKHNKEYPKNKWTETGFELTTAGFKRQYVPVINEKGEKEVWINFFCDDWGNENWKKEIMIVHDGGNCYFNLKVNLSTKKIF
jgi:hypothetical protein